MTDETHERTIDTTSDWDSGHKHGTVAENGGLHLGEYNDNDSILTDVPSSSGTFSGVFHNITFETKRQFYGDIYVESIHPDGWGNDGEARLYVHDNFSSSPQQGFDNAVLVDSWDLSSGATSKVLDGVFLEAGCVYSLGHYETDNYRPTEENIRPENSYINILESGVTGPGDNETFIYGFRNIEFQAGGVPSPGEAYYADLELRGDAVSSEISVDYGYDLSLNIVFNAKDASSLHSDWEQPYIDWLRDQGHNVTVVSDGDVGSTDYSNKHFLITRPHGTESFDNHPEGSTIAEQPVPTIVMEGEDASSYFSFGGSSAGWYQTTYCERSSDSHPIIDPTHDEQGWSTGEYVYLYDGSGYQRHMADPSNGKHFLRRTPSWVDNFSTPFSIVESGTNTGDPEILWGFTEPNKLEDFMWDIFAAIFDHYYGGGVEVSVLTKLLENNHPTFGGYEVATDGGTVPSVSQGQDLDGQYLGMKAEISNDNSNAEASINQMSVSIDVDVARQPTGVSLTVQGDQIELEWDGMDVDRWYVYRSETSESDLSKYQQIASLSPETTSYTDTGIVEGKQYHYRITSAHIADDGTGTESEPSIEVAGTTTLSAPSVSAVGAFRECDVGWEYNDDNPEGEMRIERGSTTVHTDNRDTSATDETGSYTDTGLLDGEQYEYTAIRETPDATAESNISASVLTDLPAVEDLAVVDVDGRYVTIEAVDPSNNADGYRLLLQVDGESSYSQDGSDYDPVAEGETVVFETTELLDGQEYTATVETYTEHTTSREDQ